MDVVRIGVIGCGKVSKNHFRCYKEFPKPVQLVAVCDANVAVAQQWAKDCGLPDDAVYSDYKKMLERPDLDAVDVILSHELHYDVGKACLEAGKHMLMEKPLSNTVKECIDLVDLADKKGLTLMVAQKQRYTNAALEIKKRIDAGELGTLRMVRFEANQQIRDYAFPPHWLFEGSKAGGGILISVGIHKVDLLRYWMGDIAEIQAISQIADTNFHDAEDYICCTMKFESGALGSITGTFSQFALVLPREPLVLYGDKGVLHNLPYGGKDGFRICSETTKKAGSDEFVLVGTSGPYPSEEPFINEIIHFGECVLGKKTPITSGRDNLATVAVIEAAYESLENGGKMVKVKKY